MNNKVSIKVLLCEEGVKDFAGHWAPYNQAIACGLESLGVECKIAGHLEAEQSIRDSMSFEPVFRFSRWAGTYEHRPWLVRKFTILWHNWHVYRDMAAFLKRSDPFDCIFCGNVLVYHSLAWQWLSRRFLGKKFGHVVLMLIQPAGQLDREAEKYRFPLRSVPLRWSLQRMIDESSGRVRLAVETPAAQSEFGQLVKRPVKLLHHPVDFPESWEPKQRVHTGVRRFVCPGFARAEKGSDVLQDAIRLGREQLSTLNAVFVFQWKIDGEFQRADLATERRDEELERAGLVEYEDKVLSGHDYWEFLGDSDLLILPYRCDPYTTRLSRVTIEAMQVGRPIIYPKGSWLEFAIEQDGVGLGFEDGSANSLLMTIKEAAAQLDELKERALEKAAEARASYSSKSFAEKLLAMYR